MHSEVISEPKIETLEEISAIWREEIPADLAELDQRAIWVAAVMIEGVDLAYGPESDTPLPYHNGAHSRDVIRRSLVLWRELHDTLPERFPLRDLGLIAIAAAGHDRVQLVSPGVNEKRSARATVNAMKQRGPGYYVESDRKRVSDAIMTTIVERTLEGEIHQVNLCEGERDPLKLVLAYADINGIAMEGPHRMFCDATNLFMEVFGVKNSPNLILHMDQLVDFLGSQGQFLQTRLDAMPKDVAYYFEDSNEAVPIALKLTKILHPHELALKVARFMHKNPLIKLALNNMSAGTLIAGVPEVIDYIDKEVTRQMQPDAS